MLTLFLTLYLAPYLIIIRYGMKYSSALISILIIPDITVLSGVQHCVFFQIILAINACYVPPCDYTNKACHILSLFNFLHRRVVRLIFFCDQVAVCTAALAEPGSEFTVKHAMSVSE